MRSKSMFALIPALVILTGCEFDEVGGFGRYQEDFHYTYPLKTGGRLAVDGFNGSIEVSPWDQENVDISGTKYARTADDAADIKIDIDHSTRDAVSIRATRPMTRNGNHGVRFVIKVPRSAVLDRLVTSNGAIRATDGVGPGRFKTSNGGVHAIRFHGELDVETSNGPMELNDIEGSITGHTSNGSIRGERLHGGVDLGTSNGGIRLAFDRADGGIKLGSSNGGIELTLPANATVPVRAHTSNSSITLHLPGQVNARLVASTSNGSVTSEFEMRMRGEFNRHHLEGTMGNGGPLIDLSTSNGSIRIVR
jgi:Putative adhesin